VSRLLAGARVDILAMMLERGGDLRFVPDNHVHAAAVLREHHHRVGEHPVVATEVPHAPGALAPILGLFRECGVNVEYAYSGIGSHGSAIVVLGVDDAVRAAAAAGL
jgi:hypothetical protein